MGEIPNVNPNFETMSRPRCGTWPMNRPNIEPRRNRMQGMGATLLGVTLEEGNSQEFLADDPVGLMNQMSPRDDLLSLLETDNVLTTQTDFDGMLIGPPTAAPVTDFSAISGSFVKTEPCREPDALSNYCSSTTITELSNIGQDHAYDEGVGSGQPMSGSISQNTSGLTVSPTSSSSLPKTDSCTVTVTPSQPGTSGSTPKAPKSTRKNAWGNMSYADLITQAIESSPEKRLTLAQVYEWMVKNVPYFKDKGDSNSSAGWKNSIRHNLSLHAKFKRIQNEGTGKSSWWVINHDAKPGKSPRRRAISMDNASAKCNRSKIKAAKQKAELTKKQRAGLKTGQSLQRDVGSWSRDAGIETTVSKALGSDYRPRASSNASSLGGRLSPRMFLTSDLEDDGAPPLSPPQSGMNLLANVTMPSAFNTLFDMVGSESSSIPENGPTDRMLHESMLGSLAISSPAPYSPDSNRETKDIDGMYMQSSSDMKSLGGTVAQNSPNLANLLQQKTNPLTKTVSNNAASNMAPKAEPQAYDGDSRKAFPYSDYQARMMMPASQYKSQMQQQANEGKTLYHYAGPQQNLTGGQAYRASGAMQVPSQQQYNYNLTPQQSAMISTYLGDSPPQRPQMSAMGGRQQETQFRSAASNLQQMSDAQFPPDLNGLTNHELLDAGDIDMNEIIRDMPQDYNFNMEFDKANGFIQQNVCTQVQQQTGDFGVCTNGSNNLPDNSMRSQQPVLHPNPDVFITSLQPGNAVDGCRMNSSNFHHMQTGQTSAIGNAPSYGMQ